MKTDDLKAKLRHKKKKKAIRPEDFLNTGSTLLNLAISGRPSGGFVKGRYYWLVGDSESGKTFLSLTCLAEAAINPHFADYRFIFDDAEDGALMDIERFFGPKVKERLEPPARDKETGEPMYSETIEDFYYNVDDANKDGRPFIYVLDSMDALSSASEGKKFDEQKKAHRKGTKAPGSYGDGKAKINSGNIRKVRAELKKTGSILIIISQTRDNIDAFGYGDKKTSSGGRALKFYATLQLWSSQVGNLKKTIRDKKRQIGIVSKVQVRKNRVTGRHREVEIPIYHSYGIDDVGCCIDYLVSEGHWKKSQGGIKAKDFDFVGSREALIAKIEEEELQRELRGIVGAVWNEVEDALNLKRRQRYG